MTGWKKGGLGISGLNELMGQLAGLHGAGLETVRAVVEETTRAVHDAAVRGISDGGTSNPGQYPRSQSGRLRGSVRMELPGDKGRAVGMVGSDMLHGLFLEFGTSSMEPRPWLLPSFEAGVAETRGRLKEEFEARL